MLLVIFSSVLEILANPPFSVYFLSFIFLTPFFVFLFREEGFSRLLWGSLLWKLIFLLGSLYYTFDFFLTFLKLLPFLGFPIFVFIIKKYIPKNNTAALLCLIGVGLFVFDSISNYVWLSFLAANIGTSLADGPFLGLAAFGGLWGLGIFAVFINCLITYAYLRYETRKNIKDIANQALIIVLILVVATTLSQVMLKKNKDMYESRENTLTFTSISLDKNFDKVLKGIPAVVSEEGANFVEQFIHQRFTIIKRDLAGTRSDLIIFPEDMIIAETWNYADAEAKEKLGITSSRFLIEAFRDVARTQHAYVLTNLTLMKNGGRSNSELLFSPIGEIVDFYDKNNLVIGGETWPFGTWHPFYFDLVNRYNPASPQNALKPIFYPEYRYTPGEGAHILTVGKVNPIRELTRNINSQAAHIEQPTPLTSNGTFSNGVNIGTLICAEILYPERAYDYAERGADVLIHSASNNWVSIGLDSYRTYILNLHKIEAVWLQKPIILTGVNDYAGITLPDGTFKGIDYKEAMNESFVTYTGVIHF